MTRRAVLTFILALSVLGADFSAVEAVVRCAASPQATGCCCPPGECAPEPDQQDGFNAVCCELEGPLAVDDAAPVRTVERVDPGVTAVAAVPRPLEAPRVATGREPWARDVLPPYEPPPRYDLHCAYLI